MSGKVETKREMLRAGYTFRSVAACKGCDAKIEWWRTTNGKNMPFNPLPEDQDAPATPHWATCPKRDQFKSKAEVAADNRTAREKAVGELLEGTRARAIVALYDDGNTALSWRNGVKGEDLRHELITAGNQLRWQIDTLGGKRP